MNHADIYTSLPFDVRLSILKNKPFFPLISKEYYNEGKHVFNEMYCNKPITTNEVLNYVLDDQPDHLILYEIFHRLDYYNYDIYILTKYDELSYQVKQFIVDNSATKVARQDSNERISGKLYYNVSSRKLIGEDEIDYFLTYPNRNAELFYDVQTVFNIATRRQSCMINEYNKVFTLNYMDNILYKPEHHHMDRFTKLMYGLFNIEYRNPNLGMLLTPIFDHYQQQFDYLPYYNILKNSL